MQLKTLLRTLSTALRQLAGTWLFYIRYYLVARRFKWGLPNFKGCETVALYAPGESVLTSIPEASPMTFDKTVAVNTFIFHDLKTDVCFLELSPIYRNSEVLIERIKALRPSKVYVPSHSLRYGREHTKLLISIAEKVRLYNICPLSVRSHDRLDVAFRSFFLLKRLRLMPRDAMLSPGATISRILALLYEQSVSRVTLFGVDGSTRYFVQGSDYQSFSFDTGQDGLLHITADRNKKAITVREFVSFLNAKRDGEANWITSRG